MHLAATDGAHVRLAGPRRYGKTSLLLADEASLDATGWHTIHVDFYGVTSLVEICGRIATGYGRINDHHVQSHLASLGARLGVSLGTSGIGLSLRPRQPQPTPGLGAQHGPGVARHAATAVRARPAAELVVFDEFQDLLSAGATLDGLLRSHLQYHGEAATYIYECRAVDDASAFTDRERPLYGQAEPLGLGPLPVDEVLEDLSTRFAELGEAPGEALAHWASGAGHPQRTMLLAHLLHRELAMRASGGSTLPEMSSWRASPSPMRSSRWL